MGLFVYSESNALVPCFRGWRNASSQVSVDCIVRRVKRRRLKRKIWLCHRVYQQTSLSLSILLPFLSNSFQFVSLSYRPSRLPAVV